MTRRFNLSLMLAPLVVKLLPTSRAFAHEGHDHKVMGTVTMAAADHIMLKDRAGKDVTIQVTPETKVLKDKQPMKIEDVKAGTRVVVTATMDAKNNMKAKTVEVGSTPATK
jgi:hypothetical protein